MPKYVYICDGFDGDEGRKPIYLHEQSEVEVVHSIEECDTHKEICPRCGKEMWRRPAPFRVHRSAIEVLYDKLDQRYRHYRRYGRSKNQADLSETISGKHKLPGV